MKAKAGKKGRGNGISAYYIEMDSPLDFARHISAYGWRHVKAVKVNGKYRLFSIGEKLSKVRLMYYTDLDKIGNFFVYDSDFNSAERFEIKDRMSTDTADYRHYKAPIIEILSNPYTEEKDFNKAVKVLKVEVREFDTLARSLASYAIEDEPLPRLYAFFDKNSHILGTFELFHESGEKVFTYAKMDSNEKFSALRYNYTTDTISPTNSFEEKSAVYIKVINIKKPFPFF